VRRFSKTEGEIELKSSNLKLDRGEKASIPISLTATTNGRKGWSDIHLYLSRRGEAGGPEKGTGKPAGRLRACASVKALGKE